MAKVKWLIRYGVGGGFNDVENYSIVECETEAQASDEAWQKATEIYDSYVGTGGLREVSEIMEEDELDEEEAQQAFDEERESWLDYSAELYDEEKHKDIELG